MGHAKTVAVVDYGMGNLRSVSQAVQHVAKDSGYAVLVTSRVEDVMNAERVVLPGQGAMADCMRELAESGLQAAVLHAAAHKRGHAPARLRPAPRLLLRPPRPLERDQIGRASCRERVLWYV